MTLGFYELKGFVRVCVCVCSTSPLFCVRDQPPTTNPPPSIAHQADAHKQKRASPPCVAKMLPETERRPNKRRTAVPAGSCVVTSCLRAFMCGEGWGAYVNVCTNRTKRPSEQECRPDRRRHTTCPWSLISGGVFCVGVCWTSDTTKSTKLKRTHAN